MNPLIATILCAAGIAGLFYLDRDKTARISRALWIPTIWIATNSSRPISAWLGGNAWYNQDLDSSPIDVVILAILLFAALGVLSLRMKRVRILLVANWAIFAYFFFCLISTTWSHAPDVAFKRWFKALGDVAIAMVIITDRQPLVALGRVVARVGFILFPLSILFIKYYPQLGHSYSPDGLQLNTGVTTNKNTLGVTLLVISLCALWRVLLTWRDKGLPDRRRHLIAQGVLLGFGVLLFKMANSATSTACFLLGGGLILAANFRAFRSSARMHALCLTIIVAGAAAFLLGAQDSVVHALGRKSNLSGRTEIWAAVIPAAPNALIGAGFESFWSSRNVLEFQRRLSGWWHPEELNEAHNGYIEVYLELGWVGVSLVGMILINGYRQAIKAFVVNPQVGGLFLAYIIVSAVYSITEAGFRMLDPIWIFLLIAALGSSGVAAGFLGNKTRTIPVRSGKGKIATAGAEPIPERGAIYASGALPARLSPFGANHPM
jgi:exopolysaccharide production protein ExoQ